MCIVVKYAMGEVHMRKSGKDKFYRYLLLVGASSYNNVKISDRISSIEKNTNTKEPCFYLVIP